MAEDKVMSAQEDKVNLGEAISILRQITATFAVLGKAEKLLKILHNQDKINKDLLAQKSVVLEDTENLKNEVGELEEKLARIEAAITERTGKATDIVKGAQQTATKLLADAKLQQEQIILNYKTEIESLEHTCIKQRSKLGEVTSQVDAARQQYEDTLNKIKEAKASFQKAFNMV